MRNILLLLLMVIIMSGCTNNQENEVDVMEKLMENVITHQLNEVEPEHRDEVNKWLSDAKLNGEEGQYYTKSYSDETSEFMYSYVYGKGYSDYEVSFIYTSSDEEYKGKISITGLKNTKEENTFVKIKSINDRSIMFILSDESLTDKLMN